jgi:hypothetical protein
VNDSNEVLTKEIFSSSTQPCPLAIVTTLRVGLRHAFFRLRAARLKTAAAPTPSGAAIMAAKAAVNNNRRSGLARDKQLRPQDVSKHVSTY